MQNVAIFIQNHLFGWGKSVSLPLLVPLVFFRVCVFLFQREFCFLRMRSLPPASLSAAGFGLVPHNTKLWV